LPLHDQPSAPINEELEDAVNACNNGDYRTAELLCTNILSGNPRHPNTLCLLAGIRLKQNRAKDALDLSAQAVEVAPNSAPILADRSDILNRCKLPQEALKSADDSILIDSTFVKAHINRGIALVALYRFAEAKRAFLLASDIDPGWNPVALANTVLLHCEEGRYETARKIADALAHEYPSEHAIALLSARLSMYTPSVTRREEYQRSVSVWDTKTQSIEPLSNIEPRAARPQSKIKIGYFSADFKDHPVSQFLRPVLERHDRKKRASNRPGVGTFYSNRRSRYFSGSHRAVRKQSPEYVSISARSSAGVVDWAFWYVGFARNELRSD